MDATNMAPNGVNERKPFIARRQREPLHGAGHRFESCIAHHLSHQGFALIAKGLGPFFQVPEIPELS